MTNPIVKIVNAKTGKETEREMTEAELAQFVKDAEQAKAEATLLAAQEKARKSALEKLSALGLTQAEISALTGA